MAWALARVGFLVVGTCALGAVLGALIATVLDWRDALREQRTPPASRNTRRPGRTLAP